MELLEAYADRIAARLHGGEVIGLVGDLGAGKTAFVQALARALGVADEVKSPTFVIMQVYGTGAAARERGVGQLCHVDAYRLEDGIELYGIGFDDFAGRPDTVTVVEWADRVPVLHKLPGFIELTFRFTAGGREIVEE